MPAREPGFYWVRDKLTDLPWTIARYEVHAAASFWTVISDHPDGFRGCDAEFDEIDEKRIVRDDEEKR